MSTEDFVHKARLVHGELYDYSKVKYVNNSTKVEIVCKVHGSFFPSPSNHISRKSGCMRCSKDQAATRYAKTPGQFIADAQSVHGNRYDYSHVEYRSTNIPVSIYCPTHRLLFKQTPSNHLRGQHCPQCGEEHRVTKRRKPMSVYITESNEVHNYKYDYSKLTESDYQSGSIQI
jgi:hypothetical protein